jgi:signal peptidase I
VAGRAAAALAILLVAAGCGGGGGERSYEVPTPVMEPTIHCAMPTPGCEGRRNARVRVRAYGTDLPARGDIVVLDAPRRAEQICGFGGTYFKRVIALPGDTWEERAGVIYVNGRKLAEPYVARGRRDRKTYPLHRVTGGYFVLGDWRAHSCDSRLWGQVPRANIIGKVVKISQ